MADRTPHTVCGLAEPLPLGETVFWQGRPDRGSLARHAFHSRKILIYFALLVGIRVFFSAGQPLPIRHFLAGAIPLAGLALLAWGLAHLTAWLTRRASCYAITDRRVVLRMGIAIPTAVNLPSGRPRRSVGHCSRPRLPHGPMR
ncbi:MAG: photosynthetic complex putative assembly protein PuhB [Gemmatimonadota bacterium]